MEKRLYAYKIFGGVVSGVVMDISPEEAREKVQASLKYSEKYVKHRRSGEPEIEIIDLSALFECYVDAVYELTACE